jgi:hypothetical protein
MKLILFSDHLSNKEAIEMSSLEPKRESDPVGYVNLQRFYVAVIAKFFSCFSSMFTYLRFSCSNSAKNVLLESHGSNNANIRRIKKRKTSFAKTKVTLKCNQ